MKHIVGNWTIQVIPTQDLKEHNTNFPEICECLVRLDDGYGVIIHNAFDKRQTYENTK